MSRSKGSGSASLDQALLDHGSVFASPEAVLARDDLADSNTTEILGRLDCDAS